MLADSRLTGSQQHAPAAKGANFTLGSIQHSIAVWSKEVILLLYLGLTSDTACKSELPNIKRILRSLKTSRGGLQSWYKGWKVHPVRRG